MYLWLKKKGENKKKLHEKITRQKKPCSRIRSDTSVHSVGDFCDSLGGSVVAKSYNDIVKGKMQYLVKSLAPDVFFNL